jgi:hypothetical protein
MLRKSVFVFLAVALLLGGFMVPSRSALAARPEPPTVEGIQPPAIDFANRPEIIQKGVELRNSTTAEQLTAVRAILDRYLPEVKAVHESMAALGKPQRGEPAQMDAAIVARMNKLVADIEAEMAGVLGADQMALYQAVTKPTLPGAQMSIASPQGVDGYYTSYCWYATYENTLAWYYSYYGYLYGYYDYYYYGGDLSYYAWNYAYEGWYYAGYALDYSAPLYMQTYYLGLWWSSYPYNSYYYSYYTYYYMYYAEYYSYYNYYYYGGTYAYYGWLYDYYGYYYGYYSYYDAYYCYYYLSS